MKSLNKKEVSEFARKYGISNALEYEERRLLVQLHIRFDRNREMHSGRNRNVFDCGNYVVKLPVNCEGISDNDWEGSVSNGPTQPRDNWTVRYARTRMMWVANKIPVVFMEKVEDASLQEIKNRLGNVPDWIDCVDCGQVGFNRKQELLAYDYGCN